ncbi:leucine-rich repeat domain-containing protein [Eubacterium xylanophilum]|uniref:leucine-rich repeat domain-containing protein n=1 Tax=Eubacterium xylanophilum TaxID=39497 RepID=UPI00047E9B72|nr:leucine-rich repeat domain-containing protein [Eubacterium xylanophilum]
MYKIMIFVSVFIFSLGISNYASAETKGSCGKNATYIDDGKGTLTITGTGSVDSIPSDGNKVVGASTGIKKLIIGEGITSINCNFTYEYMNAIEEVKLPSTIVDINKTFNMTKLKSITIPGSVKVIEKSAFENCSNLTSVVLENGISEIEDKAFLACTKLKEITIPKSVTRIGKSIIENTNSLMKVDNKSNQVCPLPTKRLGALKLYQTFFVDDKKVTAVPACKMAIGKWNSYKVTLKLSGGKLVGKKSLNTHTIHQRNCLKQRKKVMFSLDGKKRIADIMLLAIEYTRNYREMLHSKLCSKRLRK